MKTEKEKIEDKQTKQIRQLRAKILRLENQKDNLKQRNERLKERLAKKEADYKKLELLLTQKGKIKQPPVKKLYSLYPNIAQHLAMLCREWNIKTMNMRNTTMAILRLIEPDENDVVEYTERDIIEYINILRKLGRAGYMQNETLAHYYDPYDSLILFKHFKNIRKNLNITEGGYNLGIATLNGVALTPEQRTVVCSWQDLRNQKAGVPHANDAISIEQFKGDDLVRERERRQLKLGSVYDEQAVKDRIKYQADRYFGRDSTIEEIVKETPIIEEDDDDLDINDFEEVK